MMCRHRTVPYALALFLQLQPPCLEWLDEEACARLWDAGLQVPHVAAAAPFWQVVEKDITALAVLLLLFLLLSVLPWLVSLPRSLLGELVCCFLMGGSVDLSGMRTFLPGVCSPFLGVSFLGVSLMGTSFTRVPLVSVPLGDTFRDWLCWLCWNCASREATELLGWALWPLGVLCVLTGDGRGGGGRVSPCGGSHGGVGSIGVLDDAASSWSFFNGISPTWSCFSFCRFRLAFNPWSDSRVGSISLVPVLGIGFNCACPSHIVTLCWAT